MNAIGNKLEIKSVSYRDSGKYVCTAANLLGKEEKVVELVVEGEAHYVIILGRIVPMVPQ